MFCKNCGNEINGQTRFCTKCGAEVSGANNQSNYHTTDSCVENATVSNSCAGIATKPATKNNTLVAIIAILLVTILVCVGILGYILYTMNSDSDTDVPPTQIEGQEEEYTEDDREVENDSERYSKDEPEYLFPSDREYITEYDLRYKTKEEVALIRNEIYARHGYIFKSETYQSYFESKDWYRPNPYFDDSLFNEIEKSNKDFIVEYEKSMGWR